MEHWVWYLAAGLAAVALAEALAIVRLSRALAATARMGERLGHLTSALGLLTDTTEAGLANVAAELDRTTATRVARTARGATSRRIAAAVKRGQAVEEIAAAEGLSESEVRLHLHLAPPVRTQRVGLPTAHKETPWPAATTSR